MRIVKVTKPCKATASSGAIKCELARDHAGHHSSLKPGQKKTTQHVTWTTVSDGRVEVTTYRGGKKDGNWFEGEAASNDAALAAEVAAEREADVQREVANPSHAEERLRAGEGVGLAELVAAREVKDRRKAAKAARTFTEAEYRDDPAGVIGHAIETGTSVVAREDGLTTSDTKPYERYCTEHEQGFSRMGVCPSCAATHTERQEAPRDVHPIVRRLSLEAPTPWGNVPGTCTRGPSVSRGVAAQATAGHRRSEGVAVPALLVPAALQWGVISIPPAEIETVAELVDGIPEPAEEQRSLIKLGDATKMLAEIRDAPSAKKLMDVAAAAELYAKKAKLGQDAVNYAGGIKLDAERMLGVYLKPQPEAQRGPKTELISASENKSRLELYRELEITPKLAAEAQRLAEIPAETFAKVKAGEIKPMVALRDQRRATLGDRIAALPQGKFRVLYADPPWKYGDERNGSATAIGGDASRSDNSAAHNYPTMPTSEICAFTDETGRHVSDLAAGDAVLFMWATFPLLDDALVVMKAWKFDYKQAFVWHKQRSNVANYHDASCELLLIGVRGSCPIEIDDRVPQLQPIPRGRHSAKPEDFRRLIDRLYPSGPRVELFRRGAAPEGWTVWGNEAVA